jgi:hypothetical protein
MNSSTSLVDQLRSGSAARNIKEFAAQGMLPLAEEEMIPLQVFLTQDSDEQISQMAKATLQKVPQETWIRLVEKKDPDNDVVQYCMRATTHPVKEKILLNHSVPDHIVRTMAGTEAGSLLDIILNNQVRLLRDPDILTSLEKNTQLTLDQKRRIDEFKTEFVYKRQKQQAVDEILLPSLNDLLAQIPDLDAEAQRIIMDIDSKDTEHPTDEQVETQIKNIFSTDELNQIAPDTLSTYQRILKMSHREKVRVALLGNKEERLLLIRDASRQIASLVLRNPKITDSEMDSFSQMRNIDSELLREMGHNRHFIKRYTVCHALVRNPKTPSPVALNLLKLLRDMDLKNLERDRNIPEIIRRQAKRLRDIREEKKEHK